MKIHCAYDKLVALGKLNPHPKNRNYHPKAQIKRLAEILKYQGIRKPIIVSKRSGFITAGHGRLEAAKAAGMSSFPVNYQDYEDEAQEYADLQADNAVALWAELDLAAINSDIVDLGPDFNVDLLGIEGFAVDVAGKMGDTDVLPEPPKNPKTRPGDIYRLGDHRLMCGDSTSWEDVKRLTKGERTCLTVTDPPYNVNYGANGNENPAGWAQGKHRLIANDNMSKDDFRAFCKLWTACIDAANDGCIYVFGPPGPDGRIMFTELDNAFHCSTTGVWVKDRLVLGRGKYHNRYEPFWFGWNTAGNRFTDDRTLTNVFEFPRPSSSDLHPTMKPVELIEKCISDASKSGDTVLDLFGGSGTTLIACQRLGRHARMMELDPIYCDVIVQRWETFTGQKAKLLTPSVKKNSS